MTLLVISPDFASHYGPLSVVASAVRRSGHRVVVATGPTMRPRVLSDGLEWRRLQLGAESNGGVAALAPTVRRFLEATRNGAVATIRHQALERERDLLWEPERVAADILALVEDVDPDLTLVDQVSFGSTLGVYASGRPFVTLVPGHPSQLPVGDERYGIPPSWPLGWQPTMPALDELEQLSDRVTDAMTDRWNRALAAVTTSRPPVADATRVHGERVLYNAPAALQCPTRRTDLPSGSRFVGPLVRLPEPNGVAIDVSTDWMARPLVYVAFGTFLSHRDDVLAVVADALRGLDVRAAIALGATPPDRIGVVPDDWVVGSHLPQVELLQHAALAIHHGGNNSVQESLTAGVRQVVLPFSTDQFANAADLERVAGATTLDPNAVDRDAVAAAVTAGLASGAPERIDPPSDSRLADVVMGRASKTDEPQACDLGFRGGAKGN